MSEARPWKTFWSPLLSPLVHNDLLRSACPPSMFKWLRGDAIKEAVYIFYHIDIEDVRRSYLAHIPRLGV